MNRKGSLFDIFTWIILAFIVMTFLGIWLYAHQILTTQLESVGSFTVGQNNTIVNVSQIATQTFGQVNSAEQQWLPIIAFIIIVSEAMVILITNYFVKEHPIMFIPYAFVTAIAVVVSAYVSNAYQGLLTGGFAFSSTLNNMTMGNYIMIYLPYWVAVVGAIGTILLLAQIQKPSSDFGGGSA